MASEEPRVKVEDEQSLPVIRLVRDHGEEERKKGKR